MGSKVHSHKVEIGGLESQSLHERETSKVSTHRYAVYVCMYVWTDLSLSLSHSHQRTVRIGFCFVPTYLRLRRGMKDAYASAGVSAITQLPA